MKNEPTPDIQNELYSYCEKIVAGEIIACQKYKWSCLRFIKDADKKKSEWYFDNELAYQYITLWPSLFVHSSGFLVGEPKVFTPYERFVYGNIYGWKQKETGRRRFRRSYEQVARKNAKSQDKAIQALFEMSGFGEQKAEIYIAATKKEQTRHVWAEAAWLYQNSISEEIKERFTCKHDRDLKETIIRHNRSSSFFARLSKDDKKSGDGSNPHFFILDEYHQMDTTEYLDLAISGMKTRRNPLLSIITTAGVDITCPCYRIEYDYVSRLLNPDVNVENDRYFAVVSEIDKNETPDTIVIGDRHIQPGQAIDEIGSFEAIKKSNPVLCDNDDAVELIREETREARDKPERLRKVLTKTYNMWVNERESGYMEMQKWNNCATSTPELENKIYFEEKQQPFVGIDLSLTTDLTSISFVFNLPDGFHYVIHHSFLPENMITKATERDNMPYQLWINEGYITAIPGNNIEYHVVIDYILEQYELYNWKKGIACFDKHYAAWLETELDSVGFTSVDIHQGYSRLSLPTKTLRAKVYDKKIIHQDDPVLNWAMSNCIVRMGPTEDIMLDKKSSKHRIDPVAALINAMERAIATNSPVKKIGRAFIV